MKIGFFTDTYLPAYRGIEISVETFRQCFEKMGHEVFIYAQAVNNYQDQNPRVLRFYGWRVNKAPEMKLVLPFLPITNYKKALKQELDVIHIHTPMTMGLLGKHLARKKNIPMVYTHHTRYPELAKLYFKEKYILPYLVKSLCQWFANKSNLVIAPSLKIKKNLRSFYKINKKVPIEVVLTGVDLTKFYPSEENRINLRKKLAIELDAQVLLFVGSINKAKNSDFLFRAAKDIIKNQKNTYLVMVGDGELREPLISKAKEIQLSSRLKFTGPVAYEEIPFYYQAADLFLFPSLTDTQGIVILEAMACGLPVITLKDDAFANVVENNVNGFVVERVSASLYAKKITRLLNDQKLYQDFSYQARQTALNYSDEKEASKLIQYYRQIIKQ